MLICASILAVKTIIGTLKTASFDMQGYFIYPGYVEINTLQKTSMPI